MYAARSLTTLLDAYAHTTSTWQGIVGWISDAHPEYSRQQVANAWRRTIKPCGGKLGTYAAQSSDKARSGAVTEFGQRFYMSLVDEAVAEAERLSAPDEGPDGPIRTEWRGLADHFLLNLDEACHMANAGSAKVVGSKNRKKHEKNKNDSRISITVVECGSAAGADAPTMYLCAGKTIPPPLIKQFGSSAWLKRRGAPPNSFVLMTPNAFMTNAAWDEGAVQLAAGIRAMPVIVDHPEKWLVLFLDGFKSHVMTYSAQLTLRQHKILVVKESSDTSQCNQVFDQHPAKAAKAQGREW
jgi:hypothetical protein